MTAKDRRALFSILLLAFAVRIAFILAVPNVPLSDFADYDRLGWNLATGYGYVDDSGQPTAFRPPGYPFMLSLIYRAFGHNIWMAKFTNAILGSLTCFLLALVARFIGSQRIAILASAIYALYPSAVYYTNLLATEVLFTFLFLLAIFISLKMTRRCMARQSKSAFTTLSLLLGLVLGLAALVKPVALPSLGFLVAYSMTRFRSVKRALLFGIIILSAAALLVLPWTYRNYLVSKRLVLICTHGGMSFYLGNNLWATGDYRVPANNVLEGLTEWQLDSIGYKAGIDFVLHHPLKALWLFVLKSLKHFYLERDGFYWNFHSLQSFHQGLHSIELIAQHPVLIPAFLLPTLSSAAIIFLGLLGLKKAHSLSERPFLLVLIMLWTVTHSIFLGDDRYHFPITPILIISTANLVLDLASIRVLGFRKVVLGLLQHADVADYGISLYSIAVAVYWGISLSAKFVQCISS